MLKLNSITKKYNDVKVLNNICLSIEKDELVGIIGPNGAGKSTLVDIVSCLSRPDTGDTCFMGESIMGLKPHQIAKLGIARTFQNIQPITGLTVLERVMSGCLFGMKQKVTVKEARDYAEPILSLLDIFEIKNTFLEKLNMPQRKQVEVARALAMDPALLFLDEVTDGLNSAEMLKWIKLIEKIRDTGKSIVMIEHAMQMITKVCDRVVVINRGEKIFEGFPEEAVSNENVKKIYIGKRYLT